MTIETWTLEEGALRVLDLKEAPADEETAAEFLVTLATLQGHVAAGKGIAYYVNEDLGHPMLGHTVAFTYGTPEAQFETPEPPERCPDGLMKHITGGINWRYQLKAITTALPVISDPDWDATVPPSTQVWVAIDIAADGPDGVVVLERVLNDVDEVVSWRIVNPASDEDTASFEEIRDRLKTTFEEQGPMEELPFGRVLGHLHGAVSDITSENVIGHVEKHHPDMDRLVPDWRLLPLVAHGADHNAHDFTQPKDQ